MNKQLPNCKYLYDNTLKPGEHCCEWLSMRRGRVYPVSSLWCNSICKKYGPFCGEEPKDVKEFLTRALLRYSQVINKAFYEKVYRHYKMPCDIIIPDEWYMIKEKLKYLYELKGFRGILLTGSIIISNEIGPIKDFDIVLSFYDMKSVLDHADVINNLPQKIGRTPVDYFYYLGENPDLYFASLDCDKKILYTSKWFSLNLHSISPNIKIIHNNPADFESIIDSFYTKEEKNRILSGSCCNKL